MTQALKMPDPIEYNVDGDIHRLYCKVCGIPIAESAVVERQNRNVLVLQRADRYAEIKIRCESLDMPEGEEPTISYHVTHCCKQCIQKGLTPEMLTAMVIADTGSNSRVATGIETIDFTKRGII